jgi:hypothetical protein
MGIWGLGLYDSDAAADLRETYRACKKLGFSGAALAQLVRETTALDDLADAEGALARLALADLLLKDRALTKAVRQEAIDLIADLSVAFEDPAERRKHRAMLDRLAAKLAAAKVAAPKKGKPPFIEQCDFAIGEVLATPLPDDPPDRNPPDRNAWAVLRVIAYCTWFGGKSPICEVLAWNLPEIPSAAKIRRLRFLKRKNIPVLGSACKAETLRGLIAAKRLPPDATWSDYVDQYVAPHIPIVRVSERDPHFGKVVRTGIVTPSERPFHGDWWVPRNAWTTWKDLPVRLEEYFSEAWNPPIDPV